MSVPSLHPDRWRLLQDALDHVRIVQPAPHVAIGLLYAALKADKIAACARTFEERHPREEPSSRDEVFLGGDFWASLDPLHIHWHGSELTYRDPGNVHAGVPANTVTARGIFLFWPHVLALWPHAEEAPAAASVMVAEPVSKGRPRTHDWAAAAGALAGYLHGEGIQPQAELVRFLNRWFQSSTRNRVPDAREVERFVGTALAEFRRSTGEM